MVPQAKMSGAIEPRQPPPIEHVTQNYVPLRALILSVSERCGKELANVLRTTENLSSDNMRKDQFLRFVVACRQEYVKLYVLCKWAVVSGEISQAIDVANWLHGQVNCFNNVVGALFHLQAGLGPAKSPWADIETALQVLKYGGPLPTPESKLHLPTPPLGDREVLKVLMRLNVLISLRLALHERLPTHHRNYTVQNGRARFQLGNYMLWVELSIADEEVATQCRFFFVDCGINSLDQLDAGFKAKFEVITNEQLATKSLVEVLDWLSLYAAVYKLQLLDRQLSAAESGAGPWAGVVSHRHSPSYLSIRYFLDATDPGEARITISPRAPHSLIIDPPLDVNLEDSIENLAVQILSKATKSHAARLISTIKAPWITSVSDFTLSLELAPNKFTELTIDTTSGRYSLSGTGPLVVAAQQRFNQGHYPLDILSNLRTQVFMDTIASRAEAVGWFALRNLRLAPDEFSKIAPHTSLLALKLTNTSGWALCVAMGSKEDESAVQSTRWFASRLKCVQRRWLLGPIHNVQSNSLNLDDPDYSTFLELKSIYSKQFILYELMRELTLEKIRHAIKHQSGNNMCVVADITTILPGSSQWAQTGLLCTVDNGNIKIEGRARPGRLKALGDIKETIDHTDISINGSDGYFSVKTTNSPGSEEKNETADFADITGNPNGSSATTTVTTTSTADAVVDSDKEVDDKLHGWGGKLQSLIYALRTLHNAAKSLSSAASLKLEVRRATLTSLEIKYAEPRGLLSVKDGTHITFCDDNPQKPLASFLPAVEEHSSDSFGKIVTFLKEWYSVWNLLAELQSSRPELNLVVLPQTMNWLRVQKGYRPEAPFLEISLRDFRRQKMLNYIAAGNGADSADTITSWFKKHNTPSLIPLVTACAVEIGSEHIIKEIIESMVELSVSENPS